jgi:hypothetical protein
MAVYESLLLNTVVPQIQAAQAGDSYVMVVNATTPALRITQTGTGDSILVEDSSNPDSSPFVVTAAGDVGIGRTNPGSKLEVQFASNSYVLTTNTGDNNTGIRFANTGRDYGIFVDGGSGSINPLRFYDFTAAAERVRISSDGTFRVKGAGTAGSTDAFQVAGTAPADAARIDSSGNLLVGTTTATIYGVAFRNRVVTSGTSYAQNLVATDSVQWIHSTNTSGDNVFINFVTEAVGTDSIRGSITYNRAGGLTAYNVSSDYRAKEVYGPVTDSGAVIDSVPVYKGKMKGATQERPMFIAHETPAYAHTGVKDAVDADGKPVYQQMDASALIPVMWAEIQDLRKRLAAAGI